MEYAIRISQIEALYFMPSVKEYITFEEGITAAVGSIERGEKGRLHWQLAVRSTLGPQTLRSRILKRFPGLKGNDTDRSRTYSIQTCRKGWATNVAYCMKEMTLPISPFHEAEVIMKGITEEEVLQARAQYKIACDKPSRKPKTYLQAIVDFVRASDVVTDEDIIASMVEYHHVKGVLQPDVRFAYPRLLETVKLELAHDDNYEDCKDAFVHLIMASR